MDVAVVREEGSGTAFAVVTVTNTRCAPRIDNPEQLFVPFRGSQDQRARTLGGMCWHKRMPRGM